MIGVVLAGGFGTRMGNLPDNINKCTLKVLEKSIIRHNIDNLARTTFIKKCIIVLGYGAESVIKQLKNDSLSLKIEYCYQKRQNGLLPALEEAVQLIDDDFLLLLGDEFVYMPNYIQAYKKFQHSNYECIIGVVNKIDIEFLKSNYTLRSNAYGECSNFIEKPSSMNDNNYIGTGNIIFKKNVKDFVKILTNKGETDLIDLLNYILQMGGTIGKYSIGKFYRNINTLRDLEKVQKYMERYYE